MFPIDGLFDADGFSFIVDVFTLEGAEFASAHTGIEEDEGDVPFIV